MDGQAMTVIGYIVLVSLVIFASFMLVIKSNKDLSSEELPDTIGDLIVYYDDKSIPHFYLEVDEKAMRKIKRMDKAAVNIIHQDALFTSYIKEQ